MNKETKIPPIDLLLDYLDGMLDSINTNRIKQEIEESEEMKSIVDGIIHMRESEGYTDEQIMEYVETLNGGFVFADSNEKPEKSEAFGWWKVAASITLLIGTWFLIQLFFFKESAQDFVDDQISQTYESPQLFRDTETEWTTVYGYYENRNFDSAIAVLLEIENADSNDAMTSFYLGLCYLYDENPKQSIEHFLKVSKGSSRLNDRASWYAALAYLEIGNETSALSILKNIVDNKSYKYREAKELLDMLD